MLHGSALSEDVLREADIRSTDTLVAVTNDDQVNLLASALAKQLGCKSTLCLLNGASCAGMIRSLGIDAQINPRAITISRILQHVRRGRIRRVHSIHNGAGEVLEAEVLETAPVLGKPLKAFRSPRACAGAILREGKVFTPTGTTELEVKDRGCSSRAPAVRGVEQMFRVSPDYF